MVKKAKKTRKAIEMLYAGICDIIEYKMVKLPNKASAYEEVLVYSGIPCKVSRLKNPPAVATQTYTEANEFIKIFINPDINIKSGSKIMVLWYGQVKEYSKVGEPARYSNHQEVILTKFEGWC